VVTNLGTVLLACGLSYLLGSIPTGFWVGRLRGIDIRTLGSGNVGATNVMRVLGWGPGIFVFLIDVLKGVVAVWGLSRLTPLAGVDAIRVACGLCAVLGHTFTFFLKFKGGKGVATSFGIFLALAPFSALLAFGLFLLVVTLTHYISLGSMIAAGFFPLFVWLLGESGQNYLILILSLVLALVVMVLHRKNIQRLQSGTEHRFGQKD
jgi:acyl phosphate:glycerol-3-phosphate acyltransferase